MKYEMCLVRLSKEIHFARFFVNIIVFNSCDYISVCGREMGVGGGKVGETRAEDDGKSLISEGHSALPCGRAR